MILNFCQGQAELKVCHQEASMALSHPLYAWIRPYYTGIYLWIVLHHLHHRFSCCPHGISTLHEKIWLKQNVWNHFVLIQSFDDIVADCPKEGVSSFYRHLKEFYAALEIFSGQRMSYPNQPSTIESLKDIALLTLITHKCASSQLSTPQACFTCIHLSGFPLMSLGATGKYIF